MKYEARQTLWPRCVDTIPHALRWLKKPDGTKVLQAAYYWQEGPDNRGIEWRDVETVEDTAT